ncbi:EKC/KEOPS complex subunit LAGE3-like [Dendronephthya gigantea]|uniref:EKC/KEOPS complex subunit LAGE3-like n=1 Tax=Dendronephthya gigantea TaxID=151771 RepID=UPI00106B9728|nr:EKC/KEOPS complex subunit LAGE3-like [Dendronephthya gigantea]
MAEKLKLDLSIPFPDKEKAKIAMNSLKVDPEPRRTKVTKKLKVEENILIASFEAPEAKNLRVASNSFLDHLTLVMKTIDRFG